MNAWSRLWIVAVNMELKCISKRDWNILKYNEHNVTSANKQLLLFINIWLSVTLNNNKVICEDYGN